MTGLEHCWGRCGMALGLGLGLRLLRLLRLALRLLSGALSMGGVPARYRSASLRVEKLFVSLPVSHPVSSGMLACCWGPHL